MTARHFAQLWTALGSVLAYYSLNALVVMQGGQALFGELLFEQVDRIEALFALFVCAPF